MMAMGTGLKAQEVTVTLKPGWNWISYPNAVSMSVKDAFGDFEPLFGDVIKSKENGQASWNNVLWLGALKNFVPGQGYMYYSSRTEVTSFVFAKPVSSEVTTLVPTDITAVSAVVGSVVSIEQGNHIFARGICWGTEPNPTIDGDHIVGETVAGVQSFTLYGLALGNTYYVRAYVVTDYGLDYGNLQSFIIENGGSSDGHAYVDLDLPSGLLWATCNVGAENPEDWGDYFSWGETQPSDFYDWSTYQYCNGSSIMLTKYCNKSNYGYNGFIDHLTTLLPEDDAATANWGSEWRMPTEEEWWELYNNTTNTWTTWNGVNGRLFTASNGNSLFLPAAGYYYQAHLGGVHSGGYYWSSSLDTVAPSTARYFYFSDSYQMSSISRFWGLSVRPVRSGQN